MEFSIRPATVDDLPELRTVERLAGERFREVGLDSIADDEPPSIEVLAEYVALARAWVAADQRDMPIGYILIDEIDRATHIEQLTIHPAFQGMGIAKVLVAKAIDVALAAGSSGSLTLTTFDHVPWNRPLFEHLGFRVMSEGEWGDGLRALRKAEADRGLDPGMRVAMRMDLPGDGPTASRPRMPDPVDPG